MRVNISSGSLNRSNCIWSIHIYLTFVNSFFFCICASCVAASAACACFFEFVCHCASHHKQTTRICFPPRNNRLLPYQTGTSDRQSLRRSKSQKEVALNISPYLIIQESRDVRGGGDQGRASAKADVHLLTQRGGLGGRVRISSRRNFHGQRASDAPAKRIYF